jgi:carboxyl-terminal processing protease
MGLGSLDKAVGCAVLAFAAAAVAGCSGGGGDDGGPPQPPSAGGWVAGSYLPASSFAGKCVNPRSGTNPQSGLPYNETLGTATDENNFLRSWSNDLYLWYNEIPDRDPALYTTPAYFDLLKTPAVTASGRARDRFHFTYPTAEWLSLSQSGVEAGYGALWAVVAPAPPRRIVVAHTEPNSPASAGGIGRGLQVLRVDDVDVVNASTQAGVDAILAGLYPETIGEQHTFRVRDPRTLGERTITMQSAAVTKTPVPIAKVVAMPTGNAGYLLFNDHILTAEDALVAAIEQLRAASVSDLVLDVRYNGGGYLFLASQLAYMIAGPSRSLGQTFEKIQFNDKHTSIDPVTGQPLTPMPFLSTTRTGQPLPALNLSRVYVLTGGTTCSASESIINGLRGVGVEVVQIGSTTCGKPYGFYPEDNCGTTYFSIEFKGVNAAGFGDYTDGFSPSNTSGAAGTLVPGCSVAEDFGFALGDSTEKLFEAALNHRRGFSCPLPSGSNTSFTKPFNGAAGESEGAVVVKSPLLMNRWLERQ